MSKKNENFLPINYKVPDKSRQFKKLTPGDNRMRILSEPLLGWIFFNKSNKPVRRPFSEGEFTIQELQELNCKADDENRLTCKHFWLMLIWDYEEEIPRIIDLTQISIIKPLYALIDNEKWGDLRNFDVNINRVGTNKNDTVFTVLPDPHSNIPENAENTISDLKEKGLYDLSNIWSGGYPFEIYNY